MDHAPTERRQLISIHALHEESDKLAEPVSRHRTISIHALHEESETQTVSFALVTPFQSTLSMRRAIARLVQVAQSHNFNPRSP